MLQVERLEKIKEYTIANDFANLNELSDMLNVSKATVRRDLKRLEKEKIVEITRGGVMLAKQGNIYEQPYEIKRNTNIGEKKRIACEASKYIRQNDSIFLDSSSTVFEMVRYVNDMKNIVVATNDVLIGSGLKDAGGITLSVTGGTLRKHFFTLTGLFAEMTLSDVQFDCAFIGVDSINTKGGLMLTNIEEVRIKQIAIRNSRKIVVLCDHSKYEQVSFLNVCNFDDVDVVITGKELDEKIYNKYVEAGLTINLV